VIAREVINLKHKVSWRFGKNFAQEIVTSITQRISSLSEGMHLLDPTLPNDQQSIFKNTVYHSNII